MYRYRIEVATVGAMSDLPLFPVDPPALPAAPVRPPPGPLRLSLLDQVEALTDGGQDLPNDLLIVALSLADRIDAANAGGERRGFVMLTGEYRAARKDLLEGIQNDRIDSLDAEWAAFRGSSTGHTSGPIPND